MPYTHGYAAGFDELITKLINWAVDTAVHGADAWEVVRNEPWPRGTILKAHGWQPGEHFYVGLMPKAIEVKKTYIEWFLQKDVLAKNFVWTSKGINSLGMPFNFGISTRANLVVQRGLDPASDFDRYWFPSEIDIFTKSAQALWLGVFKQYADGLDWHEQPGGMDFTGFPLRPIYYTKNTSSTQIAYNLPMFPGAGYPAIGMDFDGPLEGYLEYWLTKDAHRLILVVKNQGYWDVAYLGFMEPYQAETEYSFPAVVIGGTSGAVLTGQDVTIVPYALPTASMGVQFDYSTENWSLTRGIPQFCATTADDVKMLSQVRLMLPDGRWQSFANWSQGMNVSPILTGGRTIGHYFTRNKPERTSVLGHTIRPTCSSLEGTHYIYRNDSGIISYQMEPVEFAQGDGHTTNLFGRLWRMYWPSARPVEYGITTIDGKAYLMLPNGWDGRRWHIYHRESDLTDPDALLAQDKEVESLSRQMNCLIRLED